jgi:hypothetical protein
MPSLNPDASKRTRASHGLAPLLLAITALIGSVVIPARQSLQILDLLRQTTEGLAPAKILTTELQAGSLMSFLGFARHPRSRSSAIGVSSTPTPSGSIASVESFRDSTRTVDRRFSTSRTG